jgi:hypothetical protein
MATATASAYRNSEELKSANFAPPLPSPLVRRIDASRLPPRIRVTLRHFIIESQQGPDLWASTFRASKAAEVSYKTMQRHIDWLEREKVLHEKHGANEFISGKGLRRPKTYVLNGTSAKWLAPRENYPEWQRRNRRQAPSRKRPAREASAPVKVCRSEQREESVVAPTPISSHPDGTPLPRCTNPTPAKSSDAKAPARTRRDCKRVIELMAQILVPKSGSGPPPKEYYVDVLKEMAERLKPIEGAQDIYLRLCTIASWLHLAKQMPRLEEVEYKLQKLETELLDVLARETDADLVEQISREVTETLRPYFGKMPQAQVDKLRTQMAASLLLKAWNLSHLSLVDLACSQVKTAPAVDRKAAFRTACKYFHFAEESVLEGFERWGFVVELEETSPLPGPAGKMNAEAAVGAHGEDEQ